MRILIATVFDYPHPGGLSTHVTTLKAGLEALGHEVDILSFSDVPPLKRNFIARGPSYILNKLNKGQGIIWSRKRRQKMLSQLISKQENYNYDIINAQDSFATLASISTGVPTVSTVHGYMAFEAISNGSVKENSSQARYLQEKEIEAYTKTRKVITVDQRIKDYVFEQAGVEGTAIRNFINVDEFKPEAQLKLELRKKLGFSTDEKILFVPRRLTKKNGVVYPALALPKILREYPNTKLIYAGTGESEEELKRLINEKQLQESVVLLGAIPHTLIKDYYAIADIVFVPSIHSAGVEEATSISALEAMGSGAPLIASAVGGLKEIVQHDIDGILTTEQDIDGLASAAIDLLNHPEKGMKLARNAREKIEKHYSHFSAAKKYEEIYLAALRDC